MPSPRHQPRDEPPPDGVRLGTVIDGGLAPAFLAVVERGIRERPTVAAGLRAEVELCPGEDYPPVRIVFGERVVLVEDGPATAPDLRITGSLGDLVSLMVAPLLGGFPSPVRSQGRLALSRLANRKVRFEGRLALTRRFLSLIRV